MIRQKPTDEPQNRPCSRFCPQKLRMQLLLSTTACPKQGAQDGPLKGPSEPAHPGHAYGWNKIKQPVVRKNLRFLKSQKMQKSQIFALIFAACHCFLSSFRSSEKQPLPRKIFAKFCKRRKSQIFAFAKIAKIFAIFAIFKFLELLAVFKNRKIFKILRFF